MEDTNVNNLNGIANFGHGMPNDGVVIAGVTDVPQPMQEDISEEMVEQEITNPEPHNEEETTQEDVPANESAEEEVDA